MGGLGDWGGREHLDGGKPDGSYVDDAYRPGARRRELGFPPVRDGAEHRHGTGEGAEHLASVRSFHRARDPVLLDLAGARVLRVAALRVRAGRPWADGERLRLRDRVQRGDARELAVGVPAA